MCVSLFQWLLHVVSFITKKEEPLYFKQRFNTEDWALTKALEGLKKEVLGGSESSRNDHKTLQN